jgi:hypothetical protein
VLVGDNVGDVVVKGSPRLHLGDAALLKMGGVENVVECNHGGRVVVVSTKAEYDALVDDASGYMQEAAIASALFTW